MVAAQSSVGIWRSGTCGLFFFNDMFELFLMGVHNGNINLSGCAITKTGMVYSPLGDRLRTMTYYRLAGSGH